ncbi:MAG: response regulator transcription factor [Corynebacterium sp.]|uniref:LuxR C-terminal-related transcriptional regulator n=1 Tax=Corynebacterium sp. TaxID=1720 RepID=UPI0026DC1800|nr:response regulator transcription factor [Corynebacterium sp.]MDO5029747.1 response regulator transcription factor [Corynebacterium sp.]
MKIVIADDSALLREGVAGIVEKRGHDVISKVDTAHGLVADIDDRFDATGELPDVVITDVRMPPKMSDDGLRAAVELRERYPQLNVMVLSQYVAPAYARELFSRDRADGAEAGGGTGYLLKDRIGQVLDFLGSLEVVAGGGVVIDPEVATALMQSGKSGLASLTAREREVLELMARGKSNSQIADELVLSGAAVAKHVSNIFVKLHLEPGEENRRVRAILEFLTATTGQI